MKIKNLKYLFENYENSKNRYFSEAANAYSKLETSEMYLLKNGLIKNNKNISKFLSAISASGLNPNMKLDVFTLKSKLNKIKLPMDIESVIPDVDLEKFYSIVNSNRYSDMKKANTRLAELEEEMKKNIQGYNETKAALATRFVEFGIYCMILDKDIHAKNNPKIESLNRTLRISDIKQEALALIWFVISGILSLIRTVWEYLFGSGEWDFSEFWLSLFGFFCCILGVWYLYSVFFVGA